MNPARARAGDRQWARAGATAWSRYLAIVVATGLTLLGAYGVALATLYQTGHLPPPPLVNELCSDVKLEWLREHPPQAPTLLVVGSSIAWRNVDSAQLAQRLPSARPLNGGFCHTQIDQTAFVTAYLLRHFPSIRTVVSVLSPADLANCAGTPSELFDPATADAYVFERRWAFPFYLSHFDAVSFVRNAFVIRAFRNSRHSAETLEMTPYGDGPIELSGAGFGGLRYRNLSRFDPVCLTDLHDMAVSIASGGRDFFVAASPVHPGWSEQLDPDGRQRDEFFADIRSTLRGTGARFWIGDAAFAGQPSDFTDTVHLNWTAAHRFSARLAEALRAGQSPL